MTTYESLAIARDKARIARERLAKQSNATYMYGFALLALAACGTDPSPAGTAPTEEAEETYTPKDPVGLPTEVNQGSTYDYAVQAGTFNQLDVSNVDSIQFRVTDSDGNEIAVDSDGVFYAASNDTYNVVVEALTNAAAVDGVVPTAILSFTRGVTVTNKAFVTSAVAETVDGVNQLRIDVTGITVDGTTDVTGLVLNQGTNVLVLGTDYTVDTSSGSVVVSFLDADSFASDADFANLSFSFGSAGEVGGATITSNADVSFADSRDNDAPDPSNIEHLVVDRENTGETQVFYSAVTIAEVGVEGANVIIVFGGDVDLKSGSDIDDLVAEMTVNLVGEDGDGNETLTGVTLGTGHTLDGNVLTLVLDAASTAGQSLRVAFNPAASSALQDVALGRSFSGAQSKDAVNSNAAGTPAEADPPVVSAVTIGGEGESARKEVTVTFSKDIGTTTAAEYADAGDFTVTSGGAAVAIASASINGAVLTLILDAAIADDASVAVTYDADSQETATLARASNATIVAADHVASAATVTTATAPAIVVENSKPLVGVDGMTITMSFTAALDATQELDGTQFAITEAGTDPALTVTGVAIAGNLVTLTLSAAVAAVADGNAVTVAYTAPADAEAPALVGLNGVAVVDIAATAATNFTGTAPTLRSAVADGTSVVLTFSREVAEADSGDLANADFVITDLSDSAATFVFTGEPVIAGNTVTLTLDTATTETDLQVAYTGGATKLVSTDATPEPAASATATGITNAPAVVSIEVYGTTMVVTYSVAIGATEAAAYADLKDFTVMSGASGSEAANAVTEASVAGNQLTLTLTTAVADGEDATFAYDADGGDTLSLASQDTSPVAVADFTGASPATAPTLTSSYVTDGSVYLVFDSPMQAAAFDVANYTVTVAETANVVTGVTVAGNIVALALTDTVRLEDGEDVTVVVVADTLSSLSGAAADLTTAVTVANEFAATPLVAPTIKEAGVVVNGDTITIEFTSALTAAADYADDSDFTVSGTTETVTGVVVAGSTVTITLSAAVTDADTITVAYAPGTDATLTGADTAAVAAFAAQPATNNTPAAPVAPTLAAENGIVVNGATITLTFDGTLAEVASYTDTADFTVVNGTVTATVTSVVVDGMTVVLTLNAPVAFGETITVAYTEAGASDTKLTGTGTGGVDVADITATPAVNNTAEAAAPVVDGAIAVNATANTITITYDIDLAVVAAETPSAGFTVTVNDTVVDAAKVTVEVTGKTVVLTVDSTGDGLAVGDAVQVAYDPAAAGAVPITHSTDGTKAAAAITEAYVSNISDAAVSGIALNDAKDAIVITMAAAITAPDPSAGSVKYTDTADFVVTVDGAPVTLDATAGIDIATDGLSITLNLAAAVTAGQTVDVAYT
nr:hypothetical protein [Alphaproteobacteria bacterium]